MISECIVVFKDVLKNGLRENPLSDEEVNKCGELPRYEEATRNDLPRYEEVIDEQLRYEEAIEIIIEHVKISRDGRSRK